MKKIILSLVLISFPLFAEQLDPYGACLTRANKTFKSNISKCDEMFYKKMMKNESVDPQKAESYAKMFQACIERAKAIYIMDKTNCEVLYRE